MSGDSLIEKQDLFQSQVGGAIPTSPLQMLIKEISYSTALICYKKWHYLSGTDYTSNINYGAYWGGHLWGAISFGPVSAKRRKGYYNEHTQNGWFEIKRLAMSNLCPKNSESRFIAISIKLLRKMYKVVGLVTLADSGQGHTGIIYKASGFEYKGLSALKNDYWIDGKIKHRGKVKGLGGEWKPKSQKHVFIKIFQDSRTTNKKYNGKFILTRGSNA